MRYRVIDMRNDEPGEPIFVDTLSTPEVAAKLALGVEVARGSASQRKLIARVYWERAGQPLNMLRLYQRKQL